MSLTRFTRDEIRAEISPRFFERGLIYQRSGRVLASATSERARFDLVTGRVQGSHSNVYAVHVELQRDQLGDLDIQGTCSCPVGYNCKHVVAVLLEELEGAPSRRAGQRPGAARDAAALSQWADRLTESERSERADAVRSGLATEVVLYLLDPSVVSGRGTSVVPVRCRMLKRGGYGKPARLNAARALDPSPPRFMQPADIEILRLLGPSGGGGTGFWLEGALAGGLLDRMLRTGRCHWKNRDGPVLGRGEPRAGRPVWVLRDDGRQALRLEADPPAACTLPLAPPWYVDLETGVSGPIETGLRANLAAEVANAPAITPEQAAALPTQVAMALDAAKLPRPRALAVEDVGGPPVPLLRLMPSDPDAQASRSFDWPWNPHGAPARARLSFDYGGVQLHCDPVRPEATVIRRDGERLTRVSRDLAFEADCFERLLEQGLEPIPSREPDDGDPPIIELGFGGLSAGPDESREWLRFMQDVLPSLRGEGWEVAIDPLFDHQIAVPDSWYAHAEEAEGGGWFDLELGVIVDGQPLSLLVVIQQWLRYPGRLAALRNLDADAEIRIRTPDGRWLLLPVRRVRSIIATLLELSDPKLKLLDGTLRLPLGRAPEVERLGEGVAGGEPMQWKGSTRLRELASGLGRFDGVEPVSPPAGFNAELRPYQRQGLGWLQFLRRYELGGILADDMGLGKTVQTLAHLLLEVQSGRADRPSLVVAPTSLVTNWAAEAKRFAPGLSVLVLHGADRARSFSRIADYHLVITTYALVHRDREVLAEQPFYLLILDEAQAIKNPLAKVTQAVRSLDAQARLCLTGTPLENHLGELWSLFDFLEPGLLGDRTQFRRLFRTPIEKHGDAARQEGLQRRVAPFMLRRAKSEVLSDLPDKTEIERVVELDDAQRDLYESIRIAMDEKVRAALADKGLARSQIVVLDALLKLRQVCCDPRLVKLEAARRVRTSAKLDLLMTMLPEMVEEGRRVLLFSQFTSMLALIEEAISERGITYVKLTGSTRDRARPVRQFQAGQAPVFLISLKAGGTGLNLTAADTVIHYDPWWNPAVETQATDRAHRIGQDKKVFVYKLVTSGTVEEKIMALQQRKRELAQSVFGKAPGEGGQQLTSADLEYLLEPLEQS